MSCFPKLNLPPSTPEQAIFPLGTCSSDYHTGDFDPSFADGRTSPEEVSQVINAIQTSRKPFISKKRLFDTLYNLAIVLGVMAIIVIRFVFFGVYDTMGLVIMVILCCIYSGMMDYAYKKKILEIFQESKLACEKAIDEQYKEVFELKGLRWVLPVSFPLWIELRKIHLNRGVGQPIYVPPNMH